MSIFSRIRDTVEGAIPGIVSGDPMMAATGAIKGATGSDGSSGGASAPSSGEVNASDVAVAPAEVGMPAPTFISYDPITAAPYKMVNIAKFAKKWGNINRQEIVKNAQLSKDLALQQLDTELQGLKNYVPAAAALKRQETAADNQFNQQQREAQIAAALPGVKEQLAAQSARAQSFASGRMPSDIEDRALELGIRSQAADRATAAGFGATSSVSRKASDLLSAQQRVTLSQYGEGLLTQNIATKSSLFLAPTEYSNAGTQINVMPSIGGAQLSEKNLTTLSAMTGISTNQALQGRLNQNQYVTNLTQRTNEFNASNTLATDQFNANAANNFALTEFQYQVGYQGTLAGVATSNNEIALQMQQQQQYYRMMQDYMQQSQQAGMLNSIFNLFGTGASAISMLAIAGLL